MYYLSELRANCTNDKVNTLVNNLSEIFLNSTKSTFETYCHKAGETHQTKFKGKPWFYLDCIFARHNYRKLKRKYHKYRSEINKQSLAESENNYKRTLDMTQKNNLQNLCKRLKNMHTIDSEEFWKILNQGKRKTQPNISLQKRFEFFKNVKTAPSDDIDFDIGEEINQIYYELNIHTQMYRKGRDS